MTKLITFLALILFCLTPQEAPDRAPIDCSVASADYILGYIDYVTPEGGAFIKFITPPSTWDDFTHKTVKGLHSEHRVQIVRTPHQPSLMEVRVYDGEGNLVLTAQLHRATSDVCAWINDQYRLVFWLRVSEDDARPREPWAPPTTLNEGDKSVDACALDPRSDHAIPAAPSNSMQ